MGINHHPWYQTLPKAWVISKKVAEQYFFPQMTCLSLQHFDVFALLLRDSHENQTGGLGPVLGLLIPVLSNTNRVQFFDNLPGD